MRGDGGGRRGERGEVGGRGGEGEGMKKDMYMKPWQNGVWGRG
jgi:hypothetical protein